MKRTRQLLCLGRALRMRRVPLFPEHPFSLPARAGGRHLRLRAWRRGSAVVRRTDVTRTSATADWLARTSAAAGWLARMLARLQIWGPCQPPLPHPAPLAAEPYYEPRYTAAPCTKPHAPHTHPPSGPRLACALARFHPAPDCRWRAPAAAAPHAAPLEAALRCTPLPKTGHLPRFFPRAVPPSSKVAPPSAPWTAR